MEKYLSLVVDKLDGNFYPNDVLKSVETLSKENSRTSVTANKENKFSAKKIDEATDFGEETEVEENKSADTEVKDVAHSLQDKEVFDEKQKSPSKLDDNVKEKVLESKKDNKEIKEKPANKSKLKVSINPSTMLYTHTQVYKCSNN